MVTVFVVVVTGWWGDCLHAQSDFRVFPSENASPTALDP
jgi:hypothetical protein